MDQEPIAVERDLSPFEKFVQALLRVPKAAVDEAEARRVKRTRKGARHGEGVK